MQTEQSQIDRLIEFKQRDKFSPAAWDDRGLNPSNDELCQQLKTLFNSCADGLLEAIDKKYSTRQLKKVLKNELANFRSLEYDTEEKEFIVDLFYELSTIVNVDFNDDLNKWLYGSILTTLLKIKKVLKPERIVETIKQPCTKCGTDLETHIMKREQGIAETSWLIVKCNNCKEFNLLSHGPDVKETRFGNYQWVENLRMDEFTHEQALTRLEQIKFFRK